MTSAAATTAPATRAATTARLVRSRLLGIKASLPGNSHDDEIPGVSDTSSTSRPPAPRAPRGEETEASMTRRLYLLRHAKSSWKNPALADHDRPLAGRGRRAAAALADHMVEHRIVSELVLCSTAVRARETYERLEAPLAGVPVHYERRLYAASADDLLERLRSVP